MLLIIVVLYCSEKWATRLKVGPILYSYIFISQLHISLFISAAPFHLPHSFIYFIHSFSYLIYFIDFTYCSFLLSIYNNIFLTLYIWTVYFAYLYILQFDIIFAYFLIYVDFGVWCSPPWRKTHQPPLVRYLHL